MKLFKFKSRRVRELEEEVERLRDAEANYHSLMNAVAGMEGKHMKTLSDFRKTTIQRDSAIDRARELKALCEEKASDAEDLRRMRDKWKSEAESLKTQLENTERLSKERADGIADCERRIRELEEQRRTWMSRAEAAEYAISRMQEGLAPVKEALENYFRTYDGEFYKSEAGGTEP